MDQLADQQWVSACPSCGSVYRFRPELTDCANCGAVLDQGITPIDLSREPKFIGVMGFLKPVADSVMSSMRDENLLCDAGGPSLAERLDGPVACGWCGQQYKTRPESPNCAACGGVLPIPPGGDPGAPPPNAPRKLPVSFLFNLYGRQNVGGIVGLICILVGIPCVLIPFIGLPLILFGVIVTYSNFATACRRHAALTRGTHRPGRLESVTRIGPAESSGHGSVLYHVYFRFEVDSQPFMGLKYSYDPAVAHHFVGQPVWVVCLPNRPHCYALWPPLA